MNEKHRAIYISAHRSKQNPWTNNSKRRPKCRCHSIGIIILLLFIVIGCPGCLQKNDLQMDAPESTQLEGANFIAEARMLYKMATCNGKGPISSTINPKVLEHHCEKFNQRIREYREEYVDSMQPVIAEHRPETSPSTVIYPFGGGDLLTALMTYPDASEIYTLSLEFSGDIRNIDQLNSQQVEMGLDLLREVTENLLNFRKSPLDTINTNNDLQATQRGPFPGQITLFLLALAIHKQEPISLRYFIFDNNGEIHYLNDAEIEARKHSLAQPLENKWRNPDFSSAFSNYELRFKPYGKAGPTPGSLK